MGSLVILICQLLLQTSALLFPADISLFCRCYFAVNFVCDSAKTRAMSLG